MSAFVGFVNESGMLKLDHPAQFKAYVARKFTGCEVVLTIENKAVAKTRAQEKGFHSMLQPWSRGEGHRIEDLKHDLLKEIFGEMEVTNQITGEVRMALREPHTSKLSKANYSHLIEETLRIAAECGVVLESPTEYKHRTRKGSRNARRAA